MGYIRINLQFDLTFMIFLGARLITEGTGGYTADPPADGLDLNDTRGEIFLLPISLSIVQFHNYTSIYRLK